MKRLAARLLWHTGLSQLARHLAARRGRFVLELHGVAARPYPDLPPALRPHIDRAALDALLSWLRPRFPFLTPEGFFDGQHGVLLTFDDGHRNLWANALPLLEHHGAPAVFFVTTRHVADPTDWLPATRCLAQRLAAQRLAAPPSTELRQDLFDGMSIDELRATAASPWVTIGSHTVSHPRLTRVTDAELAAELGESKRFLEDVVGRDVDLFAYPTGDYDGRVARAVATAGYRAAFVERSRRLGLGLFEIPRVGIYSADPAYLGLKLSGLHRRPLVGTFDESSHVL